MARRTAPPFTRSPAACWASDTSAPGPTRPQTNGKTERFIRTLIAGWAYGALYRSSAERTAALAGWLTWYNTRRPHGALSHKPPIARLNELNNLLGSYS
jgi:transposase InsO family protein